LTPQLTYFQTLVADDQTLPLTEAAFAIAQDPYPDFDIQAALVQLDTWGQMLRDRIPRQASAEYRLRALVEFYFGDLGFSGNREQYYDVANSYLNKVIENRRGIPITLAVVLIDLGKQAGLTIEGISFPGHFLTKVYSERSEVGMVIMDPFTGAVELQKTMLARISNQSGSADALFQTASAREVLIRILRNLRAVYLEMESWRNLLAIQERMVILLPNAAEERHVRGRLHARLGNQTEAERDLGE
jgi:regulator of sirC expression with transglutaminase-like and TPR domain